MRVLPACQSTLARHPQNNTRTYLPKKNSTSVQRLEYILVLRPRICPTYIYEPLLVINGAFPLDASVEIDLYQFDADHFFIEDKTADSMPNTGANLFHQINKKIVCGSN